MGLSSNKVNMSAKLEKHIREERVSADGTATVMDGQIRQTNQFKMQLESIIDQAQGLHHNKIGPKQNVSKFPG